MEMAFNTMSVFVIADTHFHHENIIKYSGRPFKTVEEMDEEMIKRWNNKVAKDDIVIHLGDFALGSKKEISNLRKRLNGSIILIKGNHDKRASGEAGFFVINGTIEIGNMIFSHNPLLKEDIPKGFVNIHGHLHEKESLNGINVCVEKINYEPLAIEDLGKLIKKKLERKS